MCRRISVCRCISVYVGVYKCSSKLGDIIIKTRSCIHQYKIHYTYNNIRLHHKEKHGSIPGILAPHTNSEIQRLL